MELINDFLKKKWAKWVIIGVVALIVVIIFPQILLIVVSIIIPAVAIYIAYKSVAPKKQKVDDETVFVNYCHNSLNDHEMHNLIISGGNSSDRFSAIAKILNEAGKKRIPTIVLHSGFAPFNQFSQNTFYDPCTGKESDDIAEVLTDAAANALDIDRVIHSSLKFIVDCMHAVKGGDITLSDIVKFPCDDVLSYLDSCKEDGSITDSQYDKFKQRYNNPAVKDNIYKASPLFAKLKPLAQSGNSAQPINFQQAVSDRQVLFFDLRSDSNTVLKELVFAEINKLTEISKFWVVTEGISFIGKTDSKVDTVFTKNQNNITLIYSGDDVPALTSQTENVFETLTGGKTKLLLFAHTSGKSAERWSEHFGMENKTKITSGRGRSTFQIGSNTNSSVSTEKDYKFPQQHFMPLAKTVDVNNRAVWWGLNQGECYFVQDNSNAVMETKSKTNMMGMVTQTLHDTYLPKIALQPTNLMLENKIG